MVSGSVATAGCVGATGICYASGRVSENFTRALCYVAETRAESTSYASPLGWHAVCIISGARHGAGEER